MERDVVLIVNPAAGGGRALRALPEAERALRAAGLRVRLAHTRDIEHARELGRAAGAAGEVAAALGGDGLVGAVADGLRETAAGGRTAAAGDRPGRTRQRLRPHARDPTRSRRRRGDDRERPRARDRPRRRAASARSSGSPRCGFDSDANRIANATRVPGDAAYLYGALRALAGWRPARFELELDGERLDARRL